MVISLSFSTPVASLAVSDVAVRVGPSRLGEPLDLTGKLTGLRLSAVLHVSLLASLELWESASPRALWDRPPSGVHGL
jgi:hypothetical protein